MHSHRANVKIIIDGILKGLNGHLLVSWVQVFNLEFEEIFCGCSSWDYGFPYSFIYLITVSGQDNQKDSEKGGSWERILTLPCILAKYLYVFIGLSLNCQRNVLNVV